MEDSSSSFERPRGQCHTQLKKRKWVSCLGSEPSLSAQLKAQVQAQTHFFKYIKLKLEL